MKIRGCGPQTPPPPVTVPPHPLHAPHHQLRLIMTAEMAGWHHRPSGHEFEQAPGVGDGQGGLACCDSRGRRVRHDWATELHNRLAEESQGGSSSSVLPALPLRVCSRWSQLSLYFLSLLASSRNSAMKKEPWSPLGAYGTSTHCALVCSEMAVSVWKWG